MVSVSGAVSTILAPSAADSFAVVPVPAAPPSSIPLPFGHAEAVELFWLKSSRFRPVRHHHTGHERPVPDGKPCITHSHLGALAGSPDLPERKAGPHQEVLDGGGGPRRRQLRRAVVL